VELERPSTSNAITTNAALDQVTADRMGESESGIMSNGLRGAH
jgi:hypothetical protein